LFLKKGVVQNGVGFGGDHYLGTQRKGLVIQFLWTKGPLEMSGILIDFWGLEIQGGNAQV